MAYLTQHIMSNINAIAKLYDSDNISLLDTLNGLNDLRGHVEFSDLPIHAVGYGNYPIEHDDTLIPLLGAQAMLYQEWRDTKNAERAEFDSASQRSIDGEPGLSSWVAACIISRLADMRYGQFVTLNALDGERAFFYRDNRILLD